MKLTKAKLQEIIKEEIDAVSEAEQYMVKSSWDSKLHRHAPDSQEMELGLKVIEKMKSDFPALIERLQIDEDILQQLSAEAVASSGYGGSGGRVSEHDFFYRINMFLEEG